MTAKCMVIKKAEEDHTEFLGLHHVGSDKNFDNCVTKEVRGPQILKKFLLRQWIPAQGGREQQPESLILSPVRKNLPSISVDGILLHAALLTVNLILKLGGWPGLLKFMLRTFAISSVLAPIGLIGFLFLVSFTPRNIKSLSKDKSVIGKPLLFPITLDHTRLSPIKNNFTFNVLFVGIPVGISCRFGRLLSIDAKHTDEEECTERSSLLRLLQTYFSSWFSFDSARYLHRGDDTLSLENKLNKFLREQNENPAKWPYAYMLSVPRFLWWERSVVTWWYLYSESKELDAVIMEINNSFDEKRNVLFKVRRTRIYTESPEKGFEQLLDCKEEHLDEDKRVFSLIPQHGKYAYKATWKKEIFSSPFEKVGETVSSTFLDPVVPSSWSGNRSLSNTTTFDPSGAPRMIARLWCKVPPIDPGKASSFQIFSILLIWTVNVTLATPRILFQAIRLHVMNLMRMMEHPDVRPGSEPRRPSKGERKDAPLKMLHSLFDLHANLQSRMLERFFREYLKHIVASYPGDLEVTYIPCKSVFKTTICLRSTQYSAEGQDPRRLRLEVMDPAFYSRIVNSPNAGTAMAKETKPGRSPADALSSPVIASDITQSLQLLDVTVSENRTYDKACSRISSWVLCLRRWLTSSFMDSFVCKALPPRTQEEYVSCLIQLWLEKLTWDFLSPHQIYRVIRAAMLQWAICWILF
ncbi:uncharacterized protein An18g01440 [Aspergillus niger]|uniref:Contig An18c0040, genomic contig n=2 Tax=Aspergillus niger TaxID=5061 RepID=E2PT45_ASPNC|nr:uncharacterized protein An18g01440 [Aspergillus niger]CAK47217.1 unnamed protein product [Aspergillus niger]